MILPFDTTPTDLVVGLEILVMIVSALSFAAILMSDDEWWPTGRR